VVLAGQRHRFLERKDSILRSLRKILLERLVKQRPGEAMFQAARLGGVSSITVALRKDSLLYRAGGGEQVELAMDRTIAPSVMQQGDWQADEVRFLAQHAPKSECVLIDVGANVGLMTRSLCHSLPQLRAAVAFEPDPGNYRLLLRNLAHLPVCHPERAALGAEEGELPFYLDEDNCGNYSLLADAMRTRGHSQIVVTCHRASEDALYAPLGEQAAAVRALPVVWKSDTQGFDEIIATTLPLGFWQRVQCGVMEIARLNRPNLDRVRLAAVLETFDVRVWSHAPTQQLSVQAIIEHSQGTDDQHADLLFARRLA
jgi:FkbM family methyltransferase